MTSLLVNMKCTLAAVDNQYTIERRGRKTYVLVFTWFFNFFIFITLENFFAECVLGEGIWSSNSVSARKRIGSISSHFVSLAPHHGWITSLYFWTNHSQACSILAGLAVIDQFYHSFIQYDPI